MYHHQVQRFSTFLVAVATLAACEREPTPTPEAPPTADAPPAAAPPVEAKAPPAPALPEPKLIEPLGDPPTPGDAIAVQLPPVPAFATATAADQYPDGSWSVAGIRKDLEARVAEGDAGKEITLEAYVTRIYVPPECPEGEVCPPAKQPHVFVADTAGEKGVKRMMMVVNYQFAIPEWDARSWKDAPEVVLEVGKQYTFKGKVRTFSDTGFAHSEGLLEFVAYHPLDPATGAASPDWVYPPGAPWHPQEIERQEAENAALAEKMSKEMSK
jgi:hypothetical protein